jgi:hypothetical protein
MSSKIILKKSSVVSKVPLVGDLDFGELAINYADSKLYFKKANGTIDSFLTGTVTSVAGKTGEVSLVSSDVGLGSVENKSSATIRSEINSSNVTTALGYTPYNSSNPAGYIDSSASITGNATTATNLQTGRTIALTGDVTYTSGSFNGSAAVTGIATLAASGVTAGSYGSSGAVPVVTVDAKGRVTAVTTAALGGSVIGTTTQVAYNNAGTMAGSANLVFNGTNLTCGGNITANSDERIKTNWRDLPEDFIIQLSGVKHGTYDRLDVAITQDGVSAQALQKVLPNSVLEDENGGLSVAYGNAALVSTIALSKRILEQEQRINKLEELISKLIAV